MLPLHVFVHAMEWYWYILAYYVGNVFVWVCVCAWRTRWSCLCAPQYSGLVTILWGATLANLGVVWQGIRWLVIALSKGKWNNQSFTSDASDWSIHSGACLPFQHFQRLVQFQRYEELPWPHSFPSISQTTWLETWWLSECLDPWKSTCPWIDGKDWKGGVCQFPSDWSWWLLMHILAEASVDFFHGANGCEWMWMVCLCVSRFTPRTSIAKPLEADPWPVSVERSTPKPLRDTPRLCVRMSRQRYAICCHIIRKRRSWCRASSGALGEMMRNVSNVGLA